MKPIYMLMFFIIGTYMAQSQENSTDFNDYINKKVEYCDMVYGSFVSNGKSKVVLLNMGADYPNQKLTIAIFEKNWSKFDYKPAEHLKGKVICVSGKVILYQKKPEIIVNEPSQIKIQ